MALIVRQTQTKQVVLFAFAALTACVLSGIVFAVYPTLSMVLLLALPLALYEEKPFQFLLAWLPLFSIVATLDLLYGAIDASIEGITFTVLPSVEQALFASQPVVWLQSALLQYIGFLAPVLTVLYFLHIILPIVFLYYLWRQSSARYLLASLSLVLLVFLSYLVFLFFPAAPPWMMNTYTEYPPVINVIADHVQKVSVSFPHPSFSSWYANLTTNPVAVFPSLQAALALLMFLWSVFLVKKFEWLFLLYTLIVSFTVVLYGQHFLIDVFAGWLFALLIFLAVFGVFSLPPLPSTSLKGSAK